jgi:hypothetical protein
MPVQAHTQGDAALTTPDRSLDGLRDRAVDPDAGDVGPDVYGEEGVEVVPLEALDPDFNEDLGVTDPMLATEGAEPYFPPTDPVISPEANDEGGASVLGGLRPSEDDEYFQEPDEVAVLAPETDDELAQAVYEELRADALTSGLDLEAYVQDGVVTLRGTVEHLDDAEAAQTVADRVPGVVEVVDELTVGSE